MRVNSIYFYATDSAMRFNFRLLAVIAISAVSGITFAQSSGTAFVVASGLLVTNQHVIEGCGAIEVIAADGRRPATVVDSVEQIDLALLRVYGLRGGVASLRTQSSAMLGESATVFGFPLGGALSSTGNFTTGVVSSLRGLRDAAGEIQITAPVQPGNSGGPVLDRAGSVIGVVSSRLSHNYTLKATGGLPQNVNFAVALDVLTDFLAKNSVSFKTVERLPAAETTQVAEMAQTFTYKISCTAASRTATAPRPQVPAPASTTAVTPTPDKLVQAVQMALNTRGFNAGPADGFIGPQTQSAIIAAQRSLGLAANGTPNEALLAALRNVSTNRSENYSRVLRSCIFPNVPNNLIAESPDTGPATRVIIRLQANSGIAISVDLVESSGVQGFDEAILNGVRRCVPFPRPYGGYPERIEVRYGR